MDPSEDFKSRYSKAKRFRDAERPFIEETLSFCCPGREKDFSRSSISSDDTERYIDLPEELATDLAGDLISYFTPSEVEWFDYDIDMKTIPEQIQDTVTDAVKARKVEIKALIDSSNYNDMAPQWGFEAASHGTPAMWVDVGHLSHPIFCEVIQPHELLLTPGYHGILDRFREVSVSANTLENLLAGLDVDLSNDKIKTKIKKPGAMAKVCWGFWLDWEDPANPQWLYEVTVDGLRVTAEKVLLGPMAGSCPLLTGRFNPQVGKPWGRGPGRRSLATMRVMDQLGEDVLAAMDASLRNTFVYGDDGMIDFSEGLEIGRAYPAGRGFDRNSLYDFSRDVNVEQGWYSEERMDDRLRRLFYQDGPRQRGETPPTLGQWVDERRRVQQRLGKPSAPLWSEMLLPFIQRVEYLGVKLGRFEQAITVGGNVVNLTPISPLLKAQNHDKVNVSRMNLEAAATFFGPENLPQVVDMISTFGNIIKASGDELTVVQKEQDAAPPPAQ